MQRKRRVISTIANQMQTTRRVVSTIGEQNQCYCAKLELRYILDERFKIDARREIYY